jgi:hypothetical protein
VLREVGTRGEPTPEAAGDIGVPAALAVMISHGTECLMQLLHDGLVSSHCNVKLAQETIKEIRSRIE